MLFIHLSVETQLGCFHILSTMNNTVSYYLLKIIYRYALKQYIVSSGLILSL